MEQLLQERPTPPEPSPRMPGRLLVAEDARCVQFSIRAILKKLGVEADMVGDGEAACDLAERSVAEGRPYDLILMDIQMPRMNGFKATEVLRYRGWKGPIIAVSVFASDADHQKILDAGCDDYATKPINEATLRDIFLRHLGANPS